MMDILVPCKGFDTGKSRLAPCLDAPGRRALCERLLTQTLQCAAAVAAPVHIHVVTADPDAAAAARRLAVATVSDPGGGLNAALAHARSALLGAGAVRESLLILPIDLPFVAPDALRAAAERAEDVVIAADEAGTGTNVLLLRARAVADFPFCYGPGSHAAHVAAARSRRLGVAEIGDWRLAFDIDDAAHYTAWRARMARAGAA